MPARRGGRELCRQLPGGLCARSAHGRAGVHPGGPSGASFPHPGLNSDTSVPARDLCSLRPKCDCLSATRERDCRLHTCGHTARRPHRQLLPGARRIPPPPSQQKWRSERDIRPRRDPGLRSGPPCPGPRPPPGRLALGVTHASPGLCGALEAAPRGRSPLPPIVPSALRTVPQFLPRGPRIQTCPRRGLTLQPKALPCAQSPGRHVPEPRGVAERPPRSLRTQRRPGGPRRHLQP